MGTKYKARTFFLMPPIIGDLNDRHPTGVEVISHVLDAKADPTAAVRAMTAQAIKVLTHKPVTDLTLDSPGRAVIRLAISNLCLFYDAYVSKTRFPIAVLRWERTKNGELDRVMVLQFLDVEVTSCDEYHGDIVLGLEFKKIKIVNPG